MPSPRGYARILQLGYQAIKEVDPDALVISGGLSSAGGGGPGAIGDLEFIRGLYDAGARGSFDGLGSHPYGGPCSYEVSSCGGEGIYFRRAEEQHNAMLVSAGLAFAVQLGSYALLRPARPGHGAPGELMLRWGIGAVMRFFVLVLYAPIARVVNLSLEAALVSLVTFFFMTMMAEPLLLEYDR